MVRYYRVLAQKNAFIAQNEGCAQRTALKNLLLGTILKRLEQMFEHYRGRYFAVGGLGYDERARRLDDIVSHNHVAAHGQAVHELCVVGDSHVSLVYRPRHVL